MCCQTKHSPGFSWKNVRTYLKGKTERTKQSYISWFNTDKITENSHVVINHVITMGRTYKNKAKGFRRGHKNEKQHIIKIQLNIVSYKS